MIQDNRLINGVIVKNEIIKEVREYTAAHTNIPSLVSILIGDQPESAMYVRNQKRAAENAGIPFDEQVWPADITQEDCKARILVMNDDPCILGVILQRPVPADFNVRSLQSAIHPKLRVHYEQDLGPGEYRMSTAQTGPGNTMAEHRTDNTRAPYT